MKIFSFTDALKNSALFVFFFFLPLFTHASKNSINCNPIVEINFQWQVMRIRPHENAFLSCTVSQDKFNEMITATLADHGSDETVFKSLFIGRLIEYPWLSRYLSMQSLQYEDWDSEKGLYKSVNINAFVAGIFSSPELLIQIQEPFAGTGYVVTGATVERVLIGKANEIEWLEINAAILIPYDAMVHFKLEKTYIAPDHQ